MFIPQNPYVAGNPVGDSTAFIGRANVLSNVTRLLANQTANTIVLYGQRRIGKTSILQQLAEQLPESGNYCPVYFDLQDKAAWSLGKVLKALACEISDNLSLPDPQDIDFSKVDTFRSQYISRVLSGLPEDSSLVLLFDEFDVLDSPSANQAGAAFFPYLRRLMEIDRRHLQFVFVIGRKPDDLTTLALSVFKGVKSKRVSLLNREDAANLVYLSKENQTLNWENQAIDEIWALTSGHPYLTQQLCEIIWNQAYNEDTDTIPTITPAQVQSAIPETIESCVHALEWLWKGLAPPERIVTSVLAQAGARSINQTELEQRLNESGVRVVISELQNAPQILQDWDLIEPTEDGYRFRVELLRRWIAKNKPISRVQEELDHIEPLANNLYQAGHGYYRNGQLEQAVNLLQQGLGINPNHLKAGLLLTQILLAKGELNEAITLLEKIYEYNPGAARPRLVQALLDQAEKTEDENDKLSIYNRILVMIPKQPEAIERRKVILENRGNVALDKGMLEEALKAYQEAALADKVAEVEKQLRVQELTELKTKTEDFEKKEQYNKALALIEQLVTKFPDEGNWGQIKTRLEKKAKLAATYQKALDALQGRDIEQGGKLLIEVINLNIGYKEALEHLLKAVKGIDVCDLQKEAQLLGKKDETKSTAISKTDTEQLKQDGTPVIKPNKLRSIPKEKLSIDDIKSMLKDKGFFDSKLNKSA